MKSKTLPTPTVLFVNVHKGASTFIADEFATAVERIDSSKRACRLGSEILRGRTFDDLAVPRRGAVFVRVYPNDVARLVEQTPGATPLEGLKLVLMHRDPRDAAVSMYYSTLYSHSLQVRSPEAFLRRRESLNAMSVAEGIATFLKPVTAEFRRVLALAEDHPDSMVTSYEQLVMDYPAWLGEVCRFAGWSEDLERRLLAKTRDSFAPPAVEDPSNHKRRITPGNWRELFDDELTQRFEDACGDEMRAAGYAT